MTALPAAGEPGRGLRVRLLQSLLGGGYLYLGLFTLVHAVLALTTHGATVSDGLCLLLVSGAQLLLVLRRGARLPAPLAAAVGTVLVVAVALGLWSLPPRLLDQSYDAWVLGAVTFDLLGLSLLGRIRGAWLTMTVITAVTVIWAPLHGMPPLDGLVMVVRHIATLVVGTALIVSLRRSRSAFAAFRALRMRRATEEEAARARDAARRVAVEQVLDVAGPTLRAIAAGRRFTDEDRRQMLVLEGSLRDQIRTPRLVRGALRDSVAAARRRGVNVLLMDEAEDAPEQARDDAAAWLAEQLDAVTEGGFVGRMRDLAGTVRVSAVHDDAGMTRSFGSVEAPA